MDWFIGKARRKDKDPNPAQQEETKQYLHAAMLESTTPEVKLREIVNLVEGLDYNEWLASHTIAFFDHVNLLYGTISEFCSMSGCPDMSGPCNRQYLWVDEKGKRCKVPAPQYIDYVMIYTQKTIHDESVFPTKFDKEFPSSFEAIVKKIMRLLYHVIAHIYHSHFKEIVLLNLHPHLNCIFAHLVLFNERFKLIEEKELEVLHDLAIALKLYPPKSDCDIITQGTVGSNDNNNNTSVSTEFSADTVISTQCRSISAFDDYKNCHLNNVIDLSEMKENTHSTCSDLNLDVNSPMMVDENYEETATTTARTTTTATGKEAQYSKSSPEPMVVEPMTSSENTKYTFDANNSLRGRSISANAVLSCGGKAPQDAFTSSPISNRRCNSDRTAVKNNFTDNRLIRPSKNHSYKLIVNIGLKLTQIIDINMKQQVMTTNLWLEQTWNDYKLTWNPKEYGGVEFINVPAEQIWLPDIVLFNNADGNYEVTLMTKATVYSTGMIVWNPPAMYKSTCKIDVEYFPFDQQSCLMKFASWTYDGHEVDIRHVKQDKGSTVVEMGVDMSEFYRNVEWDILLVPAQYNEEYYECCKEPYPDITFNITMRRKTLFYTVNLIIPCVGISFLTVLVFYLPSDSGEKVTLSISILIALTVFFLLLAEIIPPTSLAIPLLGKYLLFTMILVTLSICVTVGVLNIHFRSPSTHIMRPWIRKVLILILPRLLLMKRPSSREWHDALTEVGRRNRTRTRSEKANGWNQSYQVIQSRFRNNQSLYKVESLESVPNEDCMDSELEYMPTNPNESSEYDDQMERPAHVYTAEQIQEINHYYEQNCANLRQVFNRPEVQKAIKGIIHLSDHIKKDEADNNIMEDWKFIAMVLDRLFLWIFTLAVFCGTICIILQAPSLYDQRIPIESELVLSN